MIKVHQHDKGTLADLVKNIGNARQKVATVSYHLQLHDVRYLGAIHICLRQPKGALRRERGSNGRREQLSELNERSKECSVEKSNEFLAMRPFTLLSFVDITKYVSLLWL
jgi:hypothetical protein